MSIEDIVHAWKGCEEVAGPDTLPIPVGEELSDQDLHEVTGAVPCIPNSCGFVGPTCYGAWTD